MSFKVYNFRYNRGTKPGSTRDVLVSSANDVSGRITGYDRFADSYEGGLRKFDKDQMTALTVYDVKVIECRDEKSAIELENLGGGAYFRYGSAVAVSKKRVPEALPKLQGVREANGYVDITYNDRSFQLKSNNKTNPYIHWYSGCTNNSSGVTFEKVIEELYKETQRIK